MGIEKHVLTMLVENEPGVTARVSGLFASRGYNIESICGAPTADPNMSRITITTTTAAEKIEQIASIVTHGEGRGIALHLKVTHVSIQQLFHLFSLSSPGCDPHGLCLQLRSLALIAALLTPRPLSSILRHQATALGAGLRQWS